MTNGRWGQYQLVHVGITVSAGGAARADRTMSVGGLARFWFRVRVVTDGGTAPSVHWRPREAGIPRTARSDTTE